MTITHAFALADLRFKVFAALAGAAWHEAFQDHRRAWKFRHRASRIERKLQALH